MSEDDYHNMTADQMSFAVFCTESVAERLGKREEDTFRLLDKNNDCLHC